MSPRINARANGFIRLLPPHKLDYLHDIRFKKNSYYFAGTTASRIYLGNESDPIHFLTLDTTLNPQTSIALKIPSDLLSVTASLKLFIDSPDISVFDGTAPALLKGYLGNSLLLSRIIDNAHFMNAIPISGKSWILRIYDRNLAQTKLEKKYPDSPTTRPFNYLLEKQQDGLFSTDGILDYDRDSHLLIFVYYYRNQFICMDTNLQMIYTGRTIDTVKHASIHLTYDAVEKMTSVTGNAVLVNKLSAASGNILYVHSGLLANNEDRNLFDHASVIDMYSEQNGKYLYSFYIPYFQDEEMRNFIVRKNRLIALYEHYLVIYRLNL